MEYNKNNIYTTETMSPNVLKLTKPITPFYVMGNHITKMLFSLLSVENHACGMLDPANITVNRRKFNVKPQQMCRK